MVISFYPQILSEDFLFHKWIMQNRNPDPFDDSII